VLVPVNPAGPVQAHDVPLSILHTGESPTKICPFTMSLLTLSAVAVPPNAKLVNPGQLDYACRVASSVSALLRDGNPRWLRRPRAELLRVAKFGQSGSSATDSWS
jgi:hypothetical protein